MGSHLQQFVMHFFMLDEGPMIWTSDFLIGVASIGIVVVLTYFKLWKWLWDNWLTTVDHKKIGIMYIIAGTLMLFRGGTDGILMRAQLSWPNLHLLNASHYDQIFTTHGTIMILFMAMPMIIGLFNVAIPLQIGCRDVAFPYLNAISFWLFFVAAMLFNLSFVIGGSPDGGWTSYAPYVENMFDPGPGENYFLVAVQLTGIGTIATGVNFLVTILRMRAPGMTLMRMPMFTWSVLITSVLIVFAFPVLAVALALLLIDRDFGAHFFTTTAGGMPMQYVNLFWIWGHPEVYIVILPIFGVFSEVFSTFSSKRLFGYAAMVVSLISIGVLSFVVWLHHFFTMGAGPGVNSFFGVSTMAIAIPTGVKVFNWLFTMHRGRIVFTTAMVWAIGFVPNFLIGGLTGVMLAVPPADYQYHNSYFLVSHFHYVLIGGTVFGIFSALYYWWPKMFGVLLDEKLGKWHFWTFMIGFNICFFPMYFLGFMGMQRRMYTYPAGYGWGVINAIETVGALLMGVGFLVFVWNIVWSARFGPRDTTGDPWNGRTLEWATTSPAPHYNFARIPEVKGRDAWWIMKQNGERINGPEGVPFEPIHMPNDSGRPIIMCGFFFIAGAGFVFQWWVLAIIGLLGVMGTLALRSFEYDDHHYVPVEEIERIESSTTRGVY